MNASRGISKYFTENHSTNNLEYNSPPSAQFYSVCCQQQQEHFIIDQKIMSITVQVLFTVDHDVDKFKAKASKVVGITKVLTKIRNE